MVSHILFSSRFASDYHEEGVLPTFSSFGYWKYEKVWSSLHFCSVEIKGSVPKKNFPGMTLSTTDWWRKQTGWYMQDNIFNLLKEASKNKNQSTKISFYPFYPKIDFKKLPTLLYEWKMLYSILSLEECFLL